MKIIAYIDGFNLYSRIKHKGRGYKWLDLKALCSNLYVEHEIFAVKYFTAPVRIKPDNLQPSDYEKKAADRQNHYFKALELAIPDIEIHKGVFKKVQSWQRQSERPAEFIKVFRFEEKQTDVNLASHLINDAWRDVYEAALIISNDSDFAGAIKIVKKQHPHKKIFVASCKAQKKGGINPLLASLADGTKKINNSILKKSQLPNPVPHSRKNRLLYKPENW